METADRESVTELERTLSGIPITEVMALLVSRLGRGLVLASSLGAEDQVLAHLLEQEDPEARVVVLDTGRLPQKTYDVLERMISRTRLQFEVFFPETRRVEELVGQQGPNGFYASVANRLRCCEIRKAEPLRRALSTATGWMTGQRRAQGVTRATVKLVEWDERHDLIKVNPLADWSGGQVWEYIRFHKLPYNLLHDQGYPSIGCEPCTRAIEAGEDERAGRWWWEHPGSRECGIHVQKESLIDAAGR